MSPVAYTGCTVFNGERRLEGHAVLVAEGHVIDVVPASAIGAADRVDLGGALLAPGFIDIQVNGGGGRLFTDAPTIDTVRTIVAAHRSLGTTSLLPTLMTTGDANRAEAVAMVAAVVAAGEPGVLGIHLEGPHLNPVRAGVHDPALMCRMTRRDVAALPAGHGRLVVLQTLAPEMADPGAVADLCAKGVVVALGHSDASAAVARDAFGEGARGVTHLFNAMSGMSARSPGVAGAALVEPDVWVSLILDGHHVDDDMVALTLRAKAADRCILVSDAMPPVGGAVTSFQLENEQVTVTDGACRTAAGRLAGSAIPLAAAVRRAVERHGVTQDDALRMASTNPARFLRIDDRLGWIRPGFRADMTVLTPDLDVLGTIVGGVIER